MDYIFVDNGGNDLWATASGVDGAHGITSGTYNASSGGSGAGTGLFPGSYGPGNWTLTVTDWAGGDTGGFDSWDIRGQAVPEPATLSALGLGAAAMIRRRRARK